MLLDSPNDPDFRFARRIQAAVDRIIRSTSVPVFAANLNALTQRGQILVAQPPPISHVASGTLFLVEGTPMLVTAAHVLSDFCSDSRQLRIGMGEPQRPQPVPATENLIAADYDLDIAVLRLPLEILGRLNSKRFLNLSAIDFNADIEGWRCAVFGYLASGTHATRDAMGLVLHNFFYWTTQFDGRGAHENYDSERHLLLNFHAESRSIRDAAPVSNPLSLKGLSGASVWRVFHQRHIDGGWSIDDLRVVGVENAEYPDKVVRCTRWRNVPTLMLRVAPELEGKIARDLIH